MKRRILTTCVLSILFVAFTFAQSEQIKPVVRNAGAGDNWFVSIQGGIQSLYGDNDDKADFSDRISFQPAVSIGKWVTPSFGIRIKGTGGKLTGFEENATYKQKPEYYNIHLDGMLDLVNCFGSYSPKRTFSVGPYLGLGYTHRSKIAADVALPNSPGLIPDYRKGQDLLSAHGGLHFGFRLSKRINLDFDMGAMVVQDKFDGVVNDAAYDAVLSATGGLTIKIGKTDFDMVEPMDYELMQSLVAKNNELRAQVDELSKRPKSCPECPEPAPVVINEVNYIPNVVFFRINSARIDANQQGTIYNTAQFLKESKEKIRVIGYADKDTGSANYNLSLSEKRARAVAHELVEKYKVPSQDIIIEWKGASEQPYKESSWNRVVVMKVQ